MHRRNNRRIKSLNTAKPSNTNKSSFRLPLRPIAQMLQASVLSLGLAQAAQAAIITVDSYADDNGTGCTLREALVTVNTGPSANGCAQTGPFDSINFAGSGGTINLTAGELQLAANKTVSIDASTTNGVTINAQKNSRVVSVGDASVLEINNLTITGGSAVDGAGIYFASGGNLKATNSTIEGNTASRDGGGIYASDASMDLSTTTITGNTAGRRGGGVSTLSLAAAPSVIDIKDSFITNNETNTVGGTYGGGGGISIVGNGSLSLTNTEIKTNESVDAGGGIALSSLFGLYQPELTLNGSIVSSNTAYSGGGIFVRNAVGGLELSVTIEDSQITNNTANAMFNNAGTGSGGGLFIQSNLDDSILITGSNISDNNATFFDGGGVYFENLGGGGSLKLSAVDSTISNNSAGRDGGGVAIRGAVLVPSGDLRISNNIAKFNGGGLHFDSASTIDTQVSGAVKSLTISGNRAYSVFPGPTNLSKGGGIYFAAGFSGELVNSTISNNTSIHEGGGIFIGDSNSRLTSTYSTFYNNTTLLKEGGAIFVSADSELILRNSTLSGNSAKGFGGAVANNGMSTTENVTFSENSYIAVDNTGSLTLRNSIIANSVGGLDCGNTGTITKVATIIENSSGGACGGISGDPGLLPLADNGGPTRTHALSENSFARNAGDLASCATVDQRGDLRDDGDGKCDIGAIEFKSSDVPVNFYTIPLGNGKTVVIPL